MWRRLLRLFGYVGYGFGALLLFIAGGYLAFSFFVRSGVTSVPDLVGRTEAEAAAVLRDAGLELRVREGARRYNDTVEAGLLQQQDPGPGSIVKRGSTVDGVVSLGRELVEVPDLAGKALQAVQVELRAAGLEVGRTAGVYSAAGLPGTVVDQSPEPGSRVGRATPVELFFSLEGRAQTFLMPDLVYRDYDRVRRFFEGRGFRLGSVKFESYEGISPGIILRQFPLPGHPLRRSEVISLVVAADTTVGAGRAG